MSEYTTNGKILLNLCKVVVDAEKQTSWERKMKSICAGNQQEAESLHELDELL